MKQTIIIFVAVLIWSSPGWADLAATKPHGRVVFDRFPDDARLFQDDVRAVKDRIIRRHGKQEWELVVLTSEFHTHLGIHSIVGAKMGLRAREHFEVGIDQMSVTAYSGSKPPLSCLADGLQVSTGATLGHGTITVATNIPPLPKARFTFEGHTICLQLKQAYWNQIQADIRDIISEHGSTSEAYWSAVRQLGLKYWREWSRAEIFDLTRMDEGDGGEPCPK